MKIKDIIKEIEKLYPLELAMSWDNVGLQIGSNEKQVNNVLTTLTVTDSVVSEAIENNVDLIIAHHPLIFQSINSIVTEDIEGKRIDKLIKNDICVYVSHTNYDVANKGMNDVLTNKLELKNIRTLNEETNLGRIGTVSNIGTEDYIKRVMEQLNLTYVTFVGDKKKTINNVAVIGGSGSSEYKVALEKDVDLLITGDITYHKAIDMKEAGLNTLDVGHFIEEIFRDEIKKVINKISDKINVYISKEDVNPLEYICKK